MRKSKNLDEEPKPNKICNRCIHTCKQYDFVKLIACPRYQKAEQTTK